MKKQTVYEYRYVGENERVFPHISVQGGGSLLAVPNASYKLGPNIDHPLLVLIEDASSESSDPESKKEQ